MDAHTVVVSDCKPEVEHITVYINIRYFMILSEEIIINALKLSIQGSQISVIINVETDYLVLSILNVPQKNSDGNTGIPLECENIVFEPFFRMSKNTFEKYKTLDYGLGLNLAEKIVQKHGGKINLTNLNDYSDIGSNPVVKVHCRITIPLAGI